ncbi:hypothetical protein [Tsukamurella ocularis]|uniref:hypothetical protein n=1 Tax=Tsukamurella ocularis TaxID=1970234 RepID=UPI0021693AF2|nr:hypothetical protein [Tsukamurella ocularis]MCS3853333.1 hypothetical protein [Tsukamurella ocularis]
MTGRLCPGLRRRSRDRRRLAHEKRNPELTHFGGGRRIARLHGLLLPGLNSLERSVAFLGEIRQRRSPGADRRRDRSMLGRECIEPTADVVLDASRQLLLSVDRGVDPRRMRGRSHRLRLRAKLIGRTDHVLLLHSVMHRGGVELFLTTVGRPVNS